jgi:L-ascorbate metabolism protein UlaG (beta-lactamase superfamily)
MAASGSAAMPRDRYVSWNLSEGKRRMSTSFRFFGAAGFEIVGSEHRVVVDPFLTGNPFAPIGPEEVDRPDVILVTHAAFDHLGDAAVIARRTGAPVVCSGDVRHLLMDDGVPGEQIQSTVWGVVVRVGGVVVRPVECHHWSMAVRRNGQVITGVPLAFIFEPEPGIRVYHYGDTSYFDMRFIGELYGPTVGLLGCSQPYELEIPEPHAGEELTGEMGPDEAARAADMLGVELAVACHYFTHNADTTEFLAAAARHDSSGRRQVLAPLPGDSFVVSRDGSERLDVSETNP